MFPELSPRPRLISARPLERALPWRLPHVQPGQRVRQQRLRRVRHVLHRGARSTSSFLRSRDVRRRQRSRLQEPGTGGRLSSRALNSGSTLEGNPEGTDFVRRGTATRSRPPARRDRGLRGRRVSPPFGKGPRGRVPGGAAHPGSGRSRRKRRPARPQPG